MRLVHRFLRGLVLAVSLPGILGIVGVLPVAQVAAAGAVITVTTTDDTIADDGHCSLREALVAAQTNKAYHGCPAGSSTGVDTITMWASGQAYSVASAYTPLTGAVTIDGRGGYFYLSPAAANFFVVNGGTTTLKNMTLTGAGDTAIQVNNGATLALTSVSISSNSPSDAFLVNSGSKVIVTASTVSSNSTSGLGTFYSVAGSVTVTNSVFSANSASAGASLYSVSGTTTTVTGTSFSGDHATLGGSIFQGGGKLTVTSSTFDGDTADSGGAIQASGVVTTLDRVTISHSTASMGGGIYMSGSTNTIVGSHFDSNSATTGGSIYVSGSLTMRTSLIERSAATGPTGPGGGVYAAGTAKVYASTFLSNVAGYGAGIYVNGPSSVFANDTFSANTAAQQGGAMFVSSPVSIDNSTISKNLTGGSNAGAGLYLNVAGSSLRNSIVAGNLSAGVESDVAGSLGTNDTNVIGPVASLDTFLDPAGPKANGGPTPTTRIYKVANSPFVNKGKATVCAGANVGGKDQRGVTRPSACDIGAMELESVAPKITVAPVLRLVATGGTGMSGSSASALVTWGGSDTGGSGVRNYVLQRSVNGGSWTTIGSPSRASFSTFAAPSATFRFRVRAVDWDGNWSAYLGGPIVSSRLIQQTSTVVHYGKTWSSQSNSGFSGGSAKYAKAAGAYATMTFSGRSVTWVSTRGTDRGKARVYVDGSLVATIDLYSPSTNYRAQSFAKTWSAVGTHTIKVVVLGTSGRPRVDADAFFVLK